MSYCYSVGKSMNNLELVHGLAVLQQRLDHLDLGCVLALSQFDKLAQILDFLGHSNDCEAAKGEVRYAKEECMQQETPRRAAL